jgi:hypothetical protein
VAATSTAAVCPCNYNFHVQLWCSVIESKQNQALSTSCLHYTHRAASSHNQQCAGNQGQVLPSQLLLNSRWFVFEQPILILMVASHHPCSCCLSVAICPAVLQARVHACRSARLFKKQCRQHIRSPVRQGWHGCQPDIHFIGAIAASKRATGCCAGGPGRG